MRFVAIAIPAIVFSFAGQLVHAQSTSALDAVAQSMGGKDRVLAVRTLVIEGTGEVLTFGQTHTPYARTVSTLPTFRRSYDFAHRRWQIDQMRELRHLTPMPPPVRIRFGLDGDVGYNVFGDSEMVRTPASVATDRAAEFIYHPIGFVQAAYAPGNQVTEETKGNARRIQLSAGAMTYTMQVDSRTNLPTQISRVVDQAMLGDVAVQVELSDWQRSGDLKLPMRITQRQGRWVPADYRVKSALVNEDTGNLAASESVRAATAAEKPEANVSVEEIAPGIWLLASGEYQTIAIEQSDKMVLVEAPENDAFTLDAIAKARALRAGKPLGPLVNTHAHYDHAGGVRAAISQGLTIITHKENKDFFEKVVYPGRHTIKPDALQKNPQPLKLTAVNGKLILRDSARPIELYDVTGSPHSGSMLIGYLPKERILIQADLDSQDPAHPFSAALVETVKRLGLQVELVVGLHGRPVPWSTA